MYRAEWEEHLKKPMPIYTSIDVFYELSVFFPLVIQKLCTTIMSAFKPVFMILQPQKVAVW